MVVKASGSIPSSAHTPGLEGRDRDAPLGKERGVAGSRTGKCSGKLTPWRRDFAVVSGASHACRCSAKELGRVVPRGPT